MKKRIWSILCILAMTNLVAIAGVFGWLAASNRMSADRVRQVRTMFHETVAAEKQRAVEQKVKQEQDAAAKAEQDRMAAPPEDAASRIARQQEAEQVQLQHILKREQEQKALKDSLDRQRADL